MGPWYCNKCNRDCTEEAGHYANRPKHLRFCISCFEFLKSIRPELADEWEFCEHKEKEPEDPDACHECGRSD